MAAVTSASVLSTLLLLCISPVFVFGVQNITARPGENVSLPCSAHKNSPILVIEWRRRFQNISDVVSVYRDGQSDPDVEHPSYINRVELKDKQMKDGDVSLILKNLEIQDTGTYECRVIQGETDEGKRTETNCIINLMVFQPVQNITARPGENVSLSCSVHKNSPILVIEWRRRFQNISDVVSVYRDEQSDPEQQHPFYIDGVEQKDKQMKDGDVSLILKNLEIQDTGTYECRVIQGETDQGKRTETNCIINLMVFQPGGDEKNGGDGGHRVGLKVGLSVVALLVGVVGVVGVVMYRKRKGLKEETSYKAPDDKDTDHQ
ncbi:V-set and immunoglobulin domain-containing protein 1-like [Channa argus]|uniref:V-set and immunoglobulin domain-containing protein 1-like n=1 Tax=Channa argus TaxID=215402 RepID=UPI00351F9DCE